MIEVVEYFQPDSPERWLRRLHQIGILGVVTELERKPNGYHDGTKDRPWDLVSLRRVAERYHSMDMQVRVVEDWPPMDRVRLGLPGREEEIETIFELLANMGKLEIPIWCYNWMPVSNWTRTRTRVCGRGGAIVSGFRLTDLDGVGDTWAGNVSASQLWDAFEWFIEQIVPVAEECGVTVALHPDDPPLSPLRGVERIMTSVSSFTRVLETSPSRRNALCICVGNFTLMTPDVPAAIHSLGFDGRIAFAHLRDVRGPVEDFVEVFHDEGATLLTSVSRALKDIGFDGPVRPDHVPALYGEEVADSGYTWLGRLHAVGFLQGLVAATD